MSMQQWVDYAFVIRCFLQNGELISESMPARLLHNEMKPSKHFISAALKSTNGF